MAHQVRLCQHCSFQCVVPSSPASSLASRNTETPALTLLIALVKPRPALNGWSKGKGMGSNCVLARGVPVLLQRKRFKCRFIT